MYLIFWFVLIDWFIYIFVCLFVYLFIFYLFTYLFIYLFINLNFVFNFLICIDLFIYIYTCLFIFLFICLFVCLFVYLFIYLFCFIYSLKNLGKFLLYFGIIAKYVSILGKFTCLHFIAMAKQTKEASLALQMLAANHCSGNATLLNARCRHGRSPLHLAIHRRNSHAALHLVIYVLLSIVMLYLISYHKKNSSTTEYKYDRLLGLYP